MNQKDKEWWLKFGSIAVIIILWVIFFWWKGKNPESDTGIFIAILSILSLIGLALAFKDKLKNIFPGKKDDIPEPLSKEKIYEIIEEKANEKMNNIKIGNPYEWSRGKNIHKNVIYAFKVNCNLDNEQFIIVINATYYPKMLPTIYPTTRKDASGKDVLIEKDDYYVDKWMNDASLDPFEEPDRETLVEEIDSFGKPVRRTERITHQKKEKKEEDVV